MESHMNTNITSLNEGLENMSLRPKHLTQRQQTDKPLLKYSSSEPGPIYLYQNPDLQTTHTSSSSAPNSPAKILPTKKISSTTSVGKSTSRQFNPGKYTYVPSNDPYARPLSAKDLMTLGKERTKSYNHIMSTTLAGSIANSMHATNMTNNAVFESSKPTESLKSGQDGTLSSAQQRVMSANGYSATAATKVVSVQSSEANTLMTQTAKEKFEATLSKPSRITESGNRPPSSLRRLHSATSVRNPNYTPTKPYDDLCGSDDEDFKMVSDQNPKKKNEDNLNYKISKAINTLSRTSTGTRRQSIIQMSDSNESLAAPSSNGDTNVSECPRSTSSRMNNSSTNSAASQRKTAISQAAGDVRGVRSRPNSGSDSVTSYYL